MGGINLSLPFYLNKMKVQNTDKFKNRFFKYLYNFNIKHNFLAVFSSFFFINFFYINLLKVARIFIFF